MSWRSTQHGKATSSLRYLHRESTFRKWASGKGRLLTEWKLQLGFDIHTLLYSTQCNGFPMAPLSLGPPLYHNCPFLRVF